MVKKITSGDFLIDEIFALMIRTLNQGHWTVKQLKLEREEKEAAKKAFKFGHENFKFYDRMDYETMGLYVTNDIKNGIFHAILHIIFDSEIGRPDKEIQALEDYLWPRLDIRQKEILASYVPYKTKVIS